MSTAVDGASFGNISATQGPFYLKGGYYILSAVATWGGGNIELKLLGPDGATYLSAPTALKLTANGMIGGYLPGGQYELAVATATAIYAAVQGIPLS